MAEYDWEALVAELEDLKALPLSYSKMNTLFSCPLRYKKQYIEKTERGIPLVKEPAVVGKFVHKVLENCIHKGNAFGFEEDVVDFNRVWASILKQSNLTSKEYDMAQDQKIHARNIYNRMVGIIQKQQFKSIPELQVICTKNLQVKSGAPWNHRLLFGYIDYFGISPKGTKALIIDYKTHGKSEEHSDAVDIQTRIYGYLIMLMFPTIKVLKMGAAYIPDELVEAPITITREELKESETFLYELLLRFRDSFIVANIGTDAAFAPSMSNNCDWCNYHTTCPAMLEKEKKKKGRKKKPV